MPVIVLVVVSGALILNACTPTTDGTTEPVTVVRTDVIPDGAVDMEFVIARDAAFATIIEGYGEQAPRPDLAWITEDVTPEGMGSPTFRYSAEAWVVTISYAVVVPENVIYRVVVANEATRFHWEGEVDVAGQVMEKVAPR